MTEMSPSRLEALNEQLHLDLRRAKALLLEGADLMEGLSDSRDRAVAERDEAWARTDEEQDRAIALTHLAARYREALVTITAGLKRPTNAVGDMTLRADEMQAIARSALEGEDR